MHSEGYVVVGSVYVFVCVSDTAYLSGNALCGNFVINASFRSYGICLRIAILQQYSAKGTAFKKATRYLEYDSM